MPTLRTRTWISPGAGGWTGPSKKRNRRCSESSAMRTLLFEQAVESGAGVAGSADIRGLNCRRRHGLRSTLTHDGDSRREQFAFVRLILVRNAGGNRLQALKARRWLKVRTLLAAMHLRIALRTVAFEIGARGQNRGAAVTAGCRDGLHKPWQARSVRILERTGPLRASRLLAALTPLSAVAVRVLIPGLPVLAILIHIDLGRPSEGKHDEP